MKLRFFQLSKQSHGPYLCDNQDACFATIKSDHIPKRGQLVYLASEDINAMATPGTIYKVLYAVYCYDKDGCNSVEVTVKPTKL